LLERIAPELSMGYMRYYLRAAGASVAANADPRQAFTSAFPLPELIISAARRQLEVVLGGI
jgi:hypothetical protein